MVKIYCSIVCVIYLSMTLSGCASIYTQVAGHLNDPEICESDKGVSQIYSGTRFDLEGLNYDNVAFFCLIDLPMSVVVDTALLPYSIVSTLLEFGYCSNYSGQLLQE